MKKIAILATHGLKFEGVLQISAAGPMPIRNIREDCPLGEPIQCIEDNPNQCEFLEGIRRNTEAAKFWVLCNCADRRQERPS